MKRKHFQILDANINRAQEGLRVCEEIFRFIAKDKRLTKKIKSLRHSINRLAVDFPAEALLSARKASGDIGKNIKLKGRRYQNCRQVFSANIQRVKEALRTIEEFSKFHDEDLSRKFQSLRFKTYALEKESVKKLPTLCDLG